jgi:hypothetical protein
LLNFSGLLSVNEQGVRSSELSDLLDKIIYLSPSPPFALPHHLIFETTKNGPQPRDTELNQLCFAYYKLVQVDPDTIKWGDF